MQEPPTFSPQRRRLLFLLSGAVLAPARAAEGEAALAPPELKIAREENWLIVSGEGFADIRVNYLEAYCRAGSTDADWVKHTVIPHQNELISASADGKEIRLRDTLEDGVVVDHVIKAGPGEVDFKLEAHNPTDHASEAHWAQPCVRLGDFTGFGEGGGKNMEDYLPKCFVYLEGKPTRMPFQPWAKEARYVPGQVWCPKHVPRTDVNPRPLSTVVPSNGLIGCFSKDDTFLFATVWEPYQELFQGVARCLHSDFRLGGLDAGEKKSVRGKIYVLPNNPEILLQRYTRDFPEQQPGTP